MFVSKTIEHIRDNPTIGEDTTVIVQAIDGEQQTAIEYLDGIGEVITVGPSNLIKATLPEPKVSTLCEKAFIRAVESPEDAIR